MKIQIVEVIFALESANINRVEAMWTVVAFERADGDVNKARIYIEQFGAKKGFEAVMYYIKHLAPPFSKHEK